MSKNKVYSLKFVEGSEYPLPTDFKKLQFNIRVAAKIILSDYFQLFEEKFGLVTTDEDFQNLKSLNKSNFLFDLIINYDIFLGEVKSKKLKFYKIEAPQVFTQASKGYDQDFIQLAKKTFSSYLNTYKKKEKESDYHMYSLNGTIYTPLASINFSDLPDQPAIVFVKARIYSTFTFGEVASQVKIAGFETPDAPEAAIEHYQNSLEIPQLYPNEEIFTAFNMEKIIDYIALYLSLISSAITNFSEANGRLAFNLFLVIVANMAQLTIDVEAETKTDQIVDLLLGTGPLDYHIQSSFDQPSKRQKVEVEIDPIAELRRTTIFKDTPSKENMRIVENVEIVIAVSKDEKGSLMGGEEQEEEEEEEGAVSLKSEGEAIRTDLRDAVALRSGLGQLVAQMLDCLRRKRKASSLPSSSFTKIKFVKGILSSSQQSLFFVLVEGQESEFPTLHFVGRFSVKIFPKQIDSSSGLNFGETRDQYIIERYLKNLYFFLAEYTPINPKSQKK